MSVIMDDSPRSIGGTTSSEPRPFRDGHALYLRSTMHSAVAPLITRAQLFAVTVVWRTPGTWRIWLSTLDHRRICCSDDDVDDPALASWLARLPGWEPLRLRLALERPGLHLIWRRNDELARLIGPTPSGPGS